MSRNELITKIIVPIITALFSGVLVLWIMPDWETQARDHGWVDIAEWQAQARQKDWLPLEECPAVPVKIDLSSPGNNAEITLAYSDTPIILTGIIVVASKSLSYDPPIGLLFKPEDEINYYVVFPNFQQGSDNKHYRADFIELPFKIEQSINVSVWAFYTNDRKSVGEIYTSLEQLQNSDSVYAVSKPLSWLLHR